MKYSSPQTDFDRLQRELAGSDGEAPDRADDGDRVPDTGWRDEDWRR